MDQEIRRTSGINLDHGNVPKGRLITKGMW